MRIAILGSGSTGNVALIEAGTGGDTRPSRVLIDAGLSPTAIRRRLAALGEPCTLEEIDALLVTHEHSDHVGCAKMLGRPIFAPGPTLNARGLEGTRVRAGERFVVGALHIEPVLLLHDADETVGYVVTDGQHRVGILTDCGEPDERTARAYAGCHVLVLEANHDLGLLARGPYPPSIQRRVSGRRGHLSNEQSAELLRMILAAGPPPAVVIAAHVSQKNNRPDLVDRALAPLLPAGTRFLQATPLGAPEVRVPLLDRPAHQLTLFSQMEIPAS